MKSVKLVEILWRCEKSNRRRGINTWVTFDYGTPTASSILTYFSNKSFVIT